MATVLLFSLDGVRPDAIEVAATPTLDRLKRQGAWTDRARAEMPSVTLPCHTSMLRGVPVTRHGITSNQFQPLARPVPSLIDAAHAAGKRTGFFYNWEQLRDLAEPGSLNVSLFWRDCYAPEGDRRIAAAAAEHLRSEELDFAFIYLGWPDECAHKNGWMSDPYLRAIENADACVDEVLQAVPDPANTAVLVQSDHGGHDRSHGTDRDDDMLIPWILSGAGVRSGTELDTTVRIFDTCPTLAHLLGIPPAPEWDGRVVTEALTGPGAVSR
jgi:predicted AlkP superfamily pyrophosphatase or phosphodiesterase